MEILTFKRYCTTLHFLTLCWICNAWCKVQWNKIQGIIEKFHDFIHEKHRTSNVQVHLYSSGLQTYTETLSSFLNWVCLQIEDLRFVFPYSYRILYKAGLCGGQNNASSRPWTQCQASAGVIETNAEVISSRHTHTHTVCTSKPKSIDK